MTTTVVNIRNHDFDIYIGRAGRGQDGYFGNPFNVFPWGRHWAIQEFRKYFKEKIESDPEYKQRVLGLEGKVLGCFCKPEDCHGDIYVEYINEHRKNTPHSNTD